MSPRKPAVGLLLLLIIIGFALWGGFAVRRFSRLNEIDVKATDPWLHLGPGVPDLSQPGAHDLSQWDEIALENDPLVPDASRDEAIRLLTDASVAELDDKNLKTFAPMSPPPPNGAKPYLIRGVFLRGPEGGAMETGRFRVYHRGKDVLVHFGFYSCLASKPWGTSKGPLVIWLSFKPEKIFVTCEIDR